MSSANQWKVKVFSAKTDDKNYYSKTNIECMKTAMHVLSGNGFKLWCYFAKNQNYYEFELSKVHVVEFTGISETSYHSSIHDLIDHGYLIDKGKNYYEFHEERVESAIRHKTAKVKTTKPTASKKPEIDFDSVTDLLDNEY